MTSQPGRRIELPPEAADRIAKRAPFLFRHGMREHPLLSIPALADLADRLPVDSAIVERFGDPSFVGPHVSRARGAGPTPGELIRAIGSNGCWADLRHIEQVPAYRDLVEELLGLILHEVPRMERETVRREGFIFITAPGKVTPAHCDPECNFLMQVRGTKTIGLTPLEALDSTQLAVWQRGRGYEGGYRRPLDVPAQMEWFTVEPGRGLYLPLYAIHSVRNGDEISIALSVTCQTRTTRRRHLAHAIKGQLRRLGLLPARARA